MSPPHDEIRMTAGWTVNVVGPSWMLFVLHHEVLLRLDLLVTVKAFRICATRPACQPVHNNVLTPTESVSVATCCLLVSKNLIVLRNVINYAFFSLS